MKLRLRPQTEHMWRGNPGLRSASASHLVFKRAPIFTVGVWWIGKQFNVTVETVLVGHKTRLDLLVLDVDAIRTAGAWPPEETQSPLQAGGCTFSHAGPPGFSLFLRTLSSAFDAVNLTVFFLCDVFACHRCFFVLLDSG